MVQERLISESPGRRAVRDIEALGEMLDTVTQ